MAEGNSTMANKRSPQNEVPDVTRNPFFGEPMIQTAEKVESMFPSKNRFFVALGEVLLVASSVTIAWLLRFDFTFPNPQVLLAAMPILILLRVLGMARFNLFHGYWRYTGISDALDILKAVALGSVGFLGFVSWVF